MNRMMENKRHVLSMFVLIAGYASVFAFMQTQYEMIVERIEVSYYNKSILDNVYVRRFGYNRTTIGINASLALKHDVENGWMYVRGEKFLSNEYRPFPIYIRKNMCEVIRDDYMGLTTYFNQYVNITACPIKQGLYKVLNMRTPNSTLLPPNIPEGKYKMTFTIELQPSITALTVDGYTRIEYQNLAKFHV